LTSVQHEFLKSQAQEGITINYLLSIGIAIIIVVAAVALVYFSLSILQLKTKVLTFFEKLSPEQITLLEKSAMAFFRYLKSDNRAALNAHKGQLEQDLREENFKRRQILMGHQLIGSAAGESAAGIHVEKLDREEQKGESEEEGSKDASGRAYEESKQENFSTS
jgi:hypothetical protein